MTCPFLVIPSMKRRVFLLSASSWAVSPTPVFAQQAFPSKPIRIIAPVQPGGGVDMVARTIAERLTVSIGQSVLVENQGGGGGSVASMTTKRAAPDGYTLMLSYVGTHGTNPAVRKLAYDPIADFSHIAMIAGTPNVLVVPSSLAPSSFKEFIDLAKRNGGKMTYGSSGIGTLTHLLMEQLRMSVGFEMEHVGYRGIGPAITDTIGGTTQAMFPGLAAGLPHIRSGRLKPLAVTGLKRHPVLPQTPTLEELGLKGFDGVQWYGLSAPAGLPTPILARLNKEVNAILANEEVRNKLTIEALTVMPMSPVEFSSFIKADIAKWVRVAKERKIVIEE